MMRPISAPKTSVASRAAIFCHNVLEPFEPAPFQASELGFSIFTTAQLTLLCLLCAPTTVLSDSNIIATCVVGSYAVLLLLRYPWHITGSAIVAGGFPITLYLLALNESNPKIMMAAITLATLLSVPLCILSWQAESPRRELYNLAGRRYGFVKAQQVVRLWMVVAIATTELIFVISALAPNAMTSIALLLNSAPSSSPLAITATPTAYPCI